jgi:hypothetical protein
MMGQSTRTMLTQTFYLMPAGCKLERYILLDALASSQAWSKDRLLR